MFTKVLRAGGQSVQTVIDMDSPSKSEVSELLAKAEAEEQAAPDLHEDEPAKKKKKKGISQQQTWLRIAA